MELKGWAATDAGRRRTTNEDRYFCGVDHGVFAVADGVGGKPGGAEASEIVIEQIEQRAEEFRRFVDARDPNLHSEDRDAIFDYFADALQTINTEVYRRGSPSKFPRGIGSTADLVVVSQGAAFILHVGDSRVYLLRDDDIYRITRDHTYEQYLRQRPRLAAGERSPADYAHVLTRSIGGEPRVTIDRLFVDLKPGDRLLLCTDGITRHLSGSDILQQSVDCHGSKLPSRLIDCANDCGGEDNSTAVLVTIGAREDDNDFARAPTRPDTFRRVRFLQSVQLFSDLAFQELLSVLRYVETDHRPAGEVIISRGDPVDGLYFVMEGRVAVELDGRQMTTIEAGEHFGEFALFGQPVRSADVRCVDDSELLFISKSNLRRLVEETPDLGTELLWKLLARTSEIIQSMLAEQSDSSG